MFSSFIEKIIIFYIQFRLNQDTIFRLMKEAQYQLKRYRGYTGINRYNYVYDNLVLKYKFPLYFKKGLNYIIEKEFGIHKKYLNNLEPRMVNKRNI